MPIPLALNDGLSEKNDGQNERKNFSNELSIFLTVKRRYIAILRALCVCVALLNGTKKKNKDAYVLHSRSFVRDKRHNSCVRIKCQ